MNKTTRDHKTMSPKCLICATKTIHMFLTRSRKNTLRIIRISLCGDGTRRKQHAHENCV